MRKNVKMEETVNLENVNVLMASMVTNANLKLDHARQGKWEIEPVNKYALVKEEINSNVNVKWDII